MDSVKSNNKMSILNDSFNNTLNNNNNNNNLKLSNTGASKNSIEFISKEMIPTFSG